MDVCTCITESLCWTAAMIATIVNQLYVNKTEKKNLMEFALLGSGFIWDPR